MKPGSGRKPRLSEAECSAVIALVASPPPGRLITSPMGRWRRPASTGETSPSGRSMRWRPRPRRRASRLDAARSAGSYARKGSVGAARIPGGRPPLRGAIFAPKGPRSSPATPIRRTARRPSASMNSGSGDPAYLRAAPGWSRTGHRMKALLAMGGATRRSGSMERCGCVTAGK